MSVEFAARVNVVSGLSLLFKAAAREEAVQELQHAMARSGEVREEVLAKVNDLVELVVDPRYQNPYDTALAILLLLTGNTAPAQHLLTATLVDGAPQCWYAKKLAHSIIFPPRNPSHDAWEGEVPQAQRNDHATEYNMIVMPRGERWFPQLTKVESSGTGFGQEVIG